MCVFLLIALPYFSSMHAGELVAELLKGDAPPRLHASERELARMLVAQLLDAPTDSWLSARC